MGKIAFILIIVWPVITSVLARSFFRKQNSRQSWTGGPISKPKAMWLSYTVCNWFFLPIWLMLSTGFPEELRAFYLFHLTSWWLRGPLELVMIYKWFNWSPRYGISHDIVHIVVCIGLLTEAFFKAPSQISDPLAQVSWAFALVIVLTTAAEIWFAYLFVTTRNQVELDNNIYFASEEPKWIFINRATASVVVPAYLYLFAQSIFLMWRL